MIKAIVYTSNTGFTKRYAKLLSKEIGIEAYSFKDAKKQVNKKESIIYLGWIMGGGIKNYKKAKNRYNVNAVCGVGMSIPNDKQTEEIIKKNEITEKFIYLQGGYDPSKQKGIYKFMMESMEKVIKPKIEAKENKTANEIEMLEMMKNGIDRVQQENLKEVIKYLKG